MSTKNQGQFPLVNGGIFTVKIASGNTASDIFNCGNYQAGALLMPDIFTTANLSFKSSFDGVASTLKNVKDSSGTLISISGVAADDHISLDPAVFGFIPSFQIISSVAQAQDVEILVVLGPLWQ